MLLQFSRGLLGVALSLHSGLLLFARFRATYSARGDVPVRAAPDQEVPGRTSASLGFELVRVRDMFIIFSLNVHRYLVSAVMMMIAVHIVCVQQLSAPYHWLGYQWYQ